MKPSGANFHTMLTGLLSNLNATAEATIQFFPSGDRERTDPHTLTISLGVYQGRLIGSALLGVSDKEPK